MSIHFELVSPEEKLVSEPVQMAVIPGVEGEMGIGAGHASFVVALKPGVVKLQALDNGKARDIFIAGGFADVTGESCTVLAEEAVNLNELNQKDLEAELNTLTKDLSGADAAESARIEKKIVQTKAKLSAVTGTLVL